MQDLKDKLFKIQVRNFESRWYIPGRELNKLLSKSMVEEAVICCGIEVDKRIEVVRVILRGARKIFAILVLLGKERSIVNFMEHDHLLDQRLDSRLPFGRPELEEILDANLAEEFHRTQWIVSAPIFRNDMSHRLLNDDAILPFTENVKIGSGAFGTVFEIYLDPNHQGIWKDSQIPQDLRLIRKEIDFPDTDKKNLTAINAADAPGREGHVLSLLRLIRDPNIVRLIASYSYRGTYNLIFPRATGDLGKYLSSNERAACFNSDDAILLACQGLCGAVAALHRYIAPDYDLHMKGYHHDLKPQNVLVDDANFLLSDFGLSSLKEVDARSKTLFKEVNGFYIAPECQSIEEDFERHMIGQPADIWALGCILAVVLTHMQMGASGVQEFERARKFTVMSWTMYLFHTAGHLNPAVDVWLNKLEQGEGQYCSGLCRLIRSMLQVDPSCRPDAQKVLSKITFLAAQGLYHSIEHQLRLLSDSLNDLPILIERDRFMIFGEAIGLKNDDGEWSDAQQLFSKKVEFEIFKKYCLDLNEILDATIETPQLMQIYGSSYTQLCTCLDQFWNLLSYELRLKCVNSLERKIINTNDLDALHKIESECKDLSSYRNVGLLAAIKSMTKLAENCQIQNPELKWSHSSITSLGARINPQTTMARVRSENSTTEKDALIHYMKYNARWTDEVGQKLFARVEAIAELLHRSEKPAGFRALNCIGYYHNSSLHSFGLVFDVPHAVHSVQGPLAPLTLFSLIQGTRGQDQQPSLGDKFRLAQDLATSAFEWHKVDWLHKNISAFNVILFPQAFPSAAASITEPYIIGFNHSRPDEKNAFTEGPPVTPEQIDYCHPKYLKDRRGYKREYDYYSVGLVLLEIGLWRTIPSLSATFKASDQSPEKLREFLLEKYVARLHSLMGRTYQSAVRACLTFDVEPRRNQDGSGARDVLGEFEATVAAPLRRCFA